MQRRSWSSAKVRFFKLNYGEVMESLKRYAERALEKGARAVILIGSLARGDYTAFSDADVLVVSDSAPENPIERLRGYIDPSTPIDVEPRVYRSEELIDMALRGSRLAIEVVEHGKLLAGDGGVVVEVEEALALRKLVEKAVDEYNKYRAPEAKASIEHLKRGELKVRIEGTFCFTCGFYDYIDDLKIELEDAGVHVEVREVKEVLEEVEVTFTVKGLTSRARERLASPS